MKLPEHRIQMMKRSAELREIYRNKDLPIKERWKALQTDIREYEEYLERHDPKALKAFRKTMSQI